MRFFVTGTDTGVGKTVVCSWLCLQWNLSYFKPIQTGSEMGTDSDALRALGIPTFPEAWLFSQPVSPHYAARLAGKKIDPAAISLPNTDHLIVEGAGGVLVPINDDTLMVDLAKQWQLPVILAARGTLGTIHHTLAALEALRARQLEIRGVIVSGESQQHNIEAIEMYGQIPVLAVIPPLASLTRSALLKVAPGMLGHFTPLTRRKKQNAAASPTRGEAKSTLPDLFPTFPAGEAKSALPDSSPTVLQLRDRQRIWHPFTQEKTAPLPLGVVQAKKSWLYGEKGEAWLDLISSWWVNLHGHGHPHIALALFQQARVLEHVMFAGLTHEPAVTLCEQLSVLLPASLARFFFSDNGSTAVEVALKMAFQYWWNQGEKHRKYFLSFEGGYHGDTVGAMSVGASSGFHDPFSGLFFPVKHIPFPATWQNDDSVREKEAAALACLDEQLANCGNHIAALIAEPLVQGAAGMRMCRPGFVRTVVEKVRAAGILVIFDEVMTGFGRTGTLFALEQTGVVPDLLCLSKGLTGGALPLGLTLATERIYAAFLGEHFSAAFSHGHSYTANPLGCAAGIASLQLLQEKASASAQQTVQKGQQAGLAQLVRRCPGGVSRPRICGTIAAFDCPQAAGREKQMLESHFLAEGLLIRPLRGSVYVLPPYSTTEAELAMAWEKIIAVVG